MFVQAARAGRVHRVADVVDRLLGAGRVARVVERVLLAEVELVGQLREHAEARSAGTGTCCSAAADLASCRRAARTAPRSRSARSTGTRTRRPRRSGSVVVGVMPARNAAVLRCAGVSRSSAGSNTFSQLFARSSSIAASLVSPSAAAKCDSAKSSLSYSSSVGDVAVRVAAAVGAVLGQVAVLLLERLARPYVVDGRGLLEHVGQRVAGVEVLGAEGVVVGDDRLGRVADHHVVVEVAGIPTAAGCRSRRSS